MSPDRFSTNVPGMECQYCGKLKFSVDHHSQDGMVMFKFGKPEQWMVMAPEIALQIAHKLHDHAITCMQERSHIGGNTDENDRGTVPARAPGD